MVLNAAAGLWAAGEAKDLREGASRAAAAIDSGAALSRLKGLKAAAGEAAL